MSHLLIILLIAVAVVSLMMAGLGVKMLFRKRCEFKRPCSNIDPYTGEGAGCLCAKSHKASCPAPKHTPLEVNHEMMKEVMGER